MKLALKIALLLILPVSVFAQDAAVVKRQADAVAKALFNGDYKTIIARTYPKAVNVGGGKEKMLQILTTGINQMKSQGFSFEKVTIGQPGKFYKAGSEIHCIIPESIIMKTSQGRFLANSSLLGISNDGGKNWSFLDMNRATINLVKTLFPNFNKNLVIPEPAQPIKL